MAVDTVPVYSCCAWENRLAATKLSGFILIDDDDAAVVFADGEFAQRSADDRGVGKISGSLAACWSNDAV
jgi:hypothetical protein